MHMAYILLRYYLNFKNQYKHYIITFCETKINSK